LLPCFDEARLVDEVDARTEHRVGTSEQAFAPHGEVILVHAFPALENDPMSMECGFQSAPYV